MKIDLEVREPVNFGSGDHQYLIQKAAIKSTQAKSGQPFTYSPRDMPNRAIKYSDPKNRDGANTYAVQITDDALSSESNSEPPSPFKDMAIRKGFIMKVLLVLSIQLLITSAIVGVFTFWKALRDWIKNSTWATYAFVAAYLAVLLLLVILKDVRRQVPINYILLATFTILQGLMLGGILILYCAEEILWAAGATTVVTLLLTLFALQTKWDFTWLHGILLVFLFVFMIFGIMVIVVRAQWLNMLYACIGTLIFSLYLVMDVQMMVGGSYHYEIDPEEYIFAALNIYLDIVNLFVFILELVGR